MKPSIDYRDDLRKRLRNPRFAASYLTECLEDDDPGVFLLALRDVAEVHGGMRALARKTDLNRERLFRMLSRQGNPRLRSFRQLMDAMNLKVVLRPA